MSISVTSIAFHDGYIDVVLEGVSVGFSPQYFAIHDQAFAAAEEYACPRVLLDASRVDYTPDPILERNIAIDLVHHCQDVCRTAVVLPSNEPRAYQYLETMARRREVHTRAFAQRQEAVTWLLS